MLECFDDWYFLQVDCVTNVNLMVVASTCDEVPINWVRDAANFLRVQLLVSEALLHVQVPDGDWAIGVADSCKPI